MASSPVLTLDIIDEISECMDAFLLSEEYGVPVDGLDTVEEMKERFKLHWNKLNGVDIQAKVYTSMNKAGRDDENRCKRLKSVMQEILNIIHKDNLPARPSRRTSDLVEDILRVEGTSDNLEEDCSQRMEAMESTDLPVIVAGETSAGKSSVLNLLFDEDILPVHNNSSTSVITIIRYDKRKHARVRYKDGEPDKVFDLDEKGLQDLHKIAFMKSAAERECHNIHEVHVYLPAPILKCGLVLVDTPGIGENEFLETELTNFIRHNPLLGFIYVIKTDNAGGVQDDRLLNLLKIVLNSQRSGNSGVGRSGFDPKASLFICNRLDLIKDSELDRVKQFAVDKLAACWPSFDESQVVFLSTKKAERDIVIDSAYVNGCHRELLENTRDLFVSSIERRIKLSYKWLENVLKRIVHHLKSVVRRLDYSDKELSESSAVAYAKLKTLQDKSDNVIANLRSTIDTQTRELYLSLREYVVKSPICERKLLLAWTENEIPKVESGLGDWPWVKGKLNVAFYDRLTRCVEDWDKDERNIEQLEQELSFEIKKHLNLLEDELQDLEKEVQGDSSSDSSDSLNQSFSSTLKRMSLGAPLKRHTVLLAEARLPIRLAGRIMQPFSDIATSVGHGARLTDYKKNPTKVAEKRAKKMYQKLLKVGNGSESEILVFVNYLLERPREYIEALERKIPAMILGNKMLLSQLQQSIAVERQHQREYEEMMTSTEALRTSLKEYGEGFIYVDDFAKGELQIQHHLHDGTVASTAFNVTDFLMNSSRDMDVSRRRDIRGLWSVMCNGRVIKNGVEMAIALRMYLPLSGVDVTFKEVAKLRCLTWRDTNIAQFLGIYNADSTTPAFVYAGCLKTVRRYLHGFCSKRDTIPTMLEQTAFGLEYLHNKGLVHMELSQDTITVDDNGEVQLTGACLPRIAKLPTDTESIMTGNFAYLPPEVLSGDGYDTCADIYSLGLLIMELTNADVASVFMEQRKMTLCDFIRKANPEEMLNLKETLNVFSDTTRTVVMKCLSLSKTERPSIHEVAQILERSVFTENEESSLARLPNRRSRAIVRKRSSQEIMITHL